MADTNETVATLLCDSYPNFVSEADLVRVAGIKGPSVRNVIQRLRRAGLVIEAVRGAGWRLVDWPSERPVESPAVEPAEVVTVEILAPEPLQVDTWTWAPAPVAPEPTPVAPAQAPAPAPGPTGNNGQVRHHRDVEKALCEAGARFVRKTRHGGLYRLPNGAMVMCGRDQGNWRTVKNDLAQIRRRSR